MFDKGISKIETSNAIILPLLQDAVDALQLQLAKEEEHLLEDHKRTLQNEVINIAQEERRRKVIIH